MFESLWSTTRQLTCLGRGRRRVACRDADGRRATIVPVPRPGGRGVRIRTELGDLLFTPLEAGHLRDAVRQALLDSEIVSDTAGGQA